MSHPLIPFRANFLRAPRVLSMEIVAPVITTFRGGRLDPELFANHVKNITSKGVDVVFVAGTTGLGPALSLQEKMELTDAATSAARRVIVQVASLNADEAIALAKYAESRGAEAVASLPPYYFPRLSERQIAKYFRDLCSAVSIPVFLYNYPAAVGRDVDARAAKELGCIRGVKDTNESLAHTLAYKRYLPQARVYNGSDSLVFASFAVRLDGVVASSANYLPELLAGIRDAVAAGDIERARSLQFLLDEIVESARHIGYAAAVYELVEIFQGYEAGEPRGPVYPLDPEEKAWLRAAVAKAKSQLRL
uniref:2-dehydro-3-deoxy-D-gluconate/2-dehydro-3-deoxy-phosphogluconate aldolase n=2 Tax=Thermoproteus tenax TaxID=2271 RepID=KDGA_THETE|nr:RecName: Full=2-dehydro-3-deoxy-D-gluconate/2-dehydro-3-deoxy-phosphogluconate aldolase; Short=KD(P)G aldolase [Thermoproteus tenax]CAF18463.1 2-Keto-3-deoxy-(6-phospho-)gluconate aldolase [Thermoproteus tenax]